jgi:chloramphenicol 3-O-phosphotransferase
MDAKGLKRDSLNFLTQLTAALCYLHHSIESYMEAAASDVGQVSGWETAVHADTRPDQVFLQMPSHERFRVVKRATSVLLCL